jgi:hypothetical protein
MRKPLVAAAVALLVAAGLSRADTLPLIVAPTNFTPGTPFNFEVFAPGLSGLGDYSLAFAVTAGPPASPVDLTVSVSPPAGLTGYPFPDASNFFVATDASGNTVTVTVDDASSGLPVTTAAGVNDHLATVTIGPGVNLSGPITVTFSPDSSFGLGRDVTFDPPPAFTINPETAQPPTSVPAPAGWLLLGVGGIGVAAVRRRFGRTTG